MCLNLNDNPFKWINIYELHGNHKSEIYNRYIKTKKKGTQAYYKRKPFNHNEGNKEELQKQQEIRNKMVISIYLSIVSLNVNKLNILINRLRMTDWIKKQDTPICYL